MATEAARRRASKPTDKNIPEGIEEIIIGDGVQQYKRLRDVERKIDTVMMRKRIDMQDSMQYYSKSYRTMKIWISNTVENQPWQGRSLETDMFDFNTGLESTYKVKIEGRLLHEDFDDDTAERDNKDGSTGDPSKHQEDKEDAENPDGDVPEEKGSKPSTWNSKSKLSHFFKAITVDFDRGKDIQPDGAAQIEWKKPAHEANNPSLPPAADFDCLEFERKGDENINCTINFYRDETPERYRLSREFAEVLDVEEDDRASVIIGLWEYIKARNLQQDEEKRSVICDDRLRAVRPFIFLSLFEKKKN